MKIVANVQAKRGSSRGLVHYIAHSKLDIEREPQNSRELFNAFGDNLSVKSANNSMRVGIAKSIPSNDELHHLVLSFRDEEYRKLGAGEAQRQKALKEITRAAIKILETATNAERFLWAAAIHRNTENPHVHIAIQKRYLSTGIERQVLTKIPREALPHYEHRDSERVLLLGYLIETAAEKMEAIIDRERSRNKVSKPSGRDAMQQEYSERETESEHLNKSDPRIVAERDILAKGILAEYELHKAETRVNSLLDHGDKMRFTVSDPASGKRKRLSLREIKQQAGRNEPDHPTQTEVQIKTILHKMLVKEKVAKNQLQNDLSDVIREAKRIRNEYRKSGSQLPVPSLTKEDLDKLQEQCLDAPDIRRFSYLERVRSGLVRSREIEPRNKDDIRSILAWKNISELRSKNYERQHGELSEKSYHFRFDIGEKHASLADLDREQKDPEGPILSFLRKMKTTAARLTKKGIISTRANETNNTRNEIVGKLAEQLAGIQKTGKVEQNKTKILDGILNAGSDKHQDDPLYSADQIAEIEKLSLRLNLKDEYEKNWKDQRSIIESAGSDSRAFTKLLKEDATADLAEHKNRIIAGRSLAREIVAKVEFDRAREDLKTFQGSKRFQKFAISDKKSGTVEYVSLHDVDLPNRGSLLDRALDELFEGGEHKALCRTVSSLVAAKEERLKDDVTGAKEILVFATRNASEFKETSFFGLKSRSVYQPIFTSNEIVMLESRIKKTQDPKEAEHLQKLVDSAAEGAVRSLSDLLRDFDTPKYVSSGVKEVAVPLHIGSDDGRLERDSERSVLLHRSDREVEGHSR
ncbi:MAG: hypothetical protein KF855_11795 [Acidobacteria bacterium]|nr:hypothetical protein [Acidobacteriota bacterium]